MLSNNSYYNDDIIMLCKEVDVYLPIVDVVNNILDKFNVYESLTKLSDIDKSLVRISNLLDITNSVGMLNYSLSDFIEYVNDVIENGLAIKYSVNTGNSNAVKIMNIHKSKGLEFSLCYFTGMHNKFTIKELNDKILFSNKYGIILPYKIESLEDTFLKDLYVDNYYLEEISEKIRLFYVALTRCREKMIIVTSMDMECDKYNNMVPYDVRIKYRSFLDILNSLGILDKYIVSKDANYTDEYDNLKIKDIDEEVCDMDLIKKDIDVSYNIISNKHFSKENVKLLSKEEVSSMEYGTNIHEMLEYASFSDNNNEYVSKIMSNFDSNYINIYKEYEFIFNDNNDVYNGIIDLMIEYDDYINIVDYKLKNILDNAYIKQLNGYKKYIEKISNKKVNLYLYSIMLNELKEIID